MLCLRRLQKNKKRKSIFIFAHKRTFNAYFFFFFSFFRFCSNLTHLSLPPSILRCVQMLAGLLLLSLLLPSSPSYSPIVFIASLIQQNIRVCNKNIAERIVTKHTTYSFSCVNLGGSWRKPMRNSRRKIHKSNLRELSEKAKQKNRESDSTMATKDDDKAAVVAAVMVAAK